MAVWPAILAGCPGGGLALPTGNKPRGKYGPRKNRTFWVGVSNRAPQIACAERQVKKEQHFLCWEFNLRILRNSLDNAGPTAPAPPRRPHRAGCAGAPLRRLRTPLRGCPPPAPLRTRAACNSEPRENRHPRALYHAGRPGTRRKSRNFLRSSGTFRLTQPTFSVWEWTITTFRAQHRDRRPRMASLATR